MNFFQSCTVSIQDLPISCQLRSPNGSVSVYRPNTDFSVFPQLRFIWAQTQRIITVLPAWALGFDCSEWVGNGTVGASQCDTGHELNTSIPVRCTVTWQHCLGRFILISDSLAWAERAVEYCVIAGSPNKAIGFICCHANLDGGEKRKIKWKWHTELKDGGSHHKWLMIADSIVYLLFVLF